MKLRTNIYVILTWWNQPQGAILHRKLRAASLQTSCLHLVPTKTCVDKWSMWDMCVPCMKKMQYINSIDWIFHCTETRRSALENLRRHLGVYLYLVDCSEDVWWTVNFVVSCACVAAIDLHLVFCLASSQEVQLCCWLLMFDASCLTVHWTYIHTLRYFHLQCNNQAINHFVITVGTGVWTAVIYFLSLLRGNSDRAFFEEFGPYDTRGTK